MKIVKGMLSSIFQKAAQPVFDHIQKKLENRNAAAENTLATQIALVANKNEVCLQHPPENLDANSFPLQPDTLKTGVALTFYPDPSVVPGIEHFTTKTGHALLKESEMPDGRKRLFVWNEEEQTYHEHQEIYTEKAAKGQHAQFAAYYDVKNHCITINYDGTKYTNIDDIKSAAQTVMGAPDMRMTRVKGCIDETMKRFEKYYPGQLANTPVDIYAHSTGANFVALTNYFLQREYGVVPRSQVMFDPLGAKNSFKKVAEMVAEAEGRDPNTVFDELTANAVSFKVKGGTFIDKLNGLNRFMHNGGNSPATVGQVEVENVKGNPVTAHMGKAWVKNFNEVECAAVKRSATASTGTPLH